jgi:hypothetical protein
MENKSFEEEMKKIKALNTTTLQHGKISLSVRIGLFS